MALFVHVGQCGCSVGFEFWKLMANEKKANPDGFKSGCFFDGKGFARAMFVDSEPKVIQYIFKVIFFSLNSGM